ncbi:MAG TPA: hypothetical protein ENI51_12315 [Candidatus Atribacteria bacterium]|nr:hypothetical protein [Candidatus Atribacteria bacterium]
MDEKVAIKLLKEVKEILDEYNIEFWLDSGTLLGAIRDGKFIPWDGDIDLGVWYRDFDKIVNVAKYLHGRGFEIHFGLSHVGIIKRVDGKKCVISIDAYHREGNQAVTSISLIHPKEKFYFKREIRVDIIKRKVRLLIKYFIWLLSAPSYPGDGPKFIPNKIHLMLVKFSSLYSSFNRELLSRILKKTAIILGCKPVRIVVPMRYFRKLSTINFYETPFKIPHPAEEYLRYRYGKGWRIPKKNYIYYMEDGAIEENRSLK